MRSAIMIESHENDFQEVKSVPSWILEESEDNDFNAHGLELAESVIRNVMRQEVSVLHITKILRLGKWV